METSDLASELAHALPTDLIVYSEDRDLLKEIKGEIESFADVTVRPFKGTVSAGPPIPLPDQILALVLTLGSAGAFTAVYQVLVKFLERNKDREITLQRGDTKITIRGHSLHEERALIRELYPESFIQRPR